jgi:DNA-binding NtrC family response regulator
MEFIPKGDQTGGAVWNRADAGNAMIGQGRPFAPDCESPGYSPIPSVTGKGRILIVDDNEFVRETLADLLEIAGFCPVQAGDAADALIILQKEPVIDALVTDLTMPGADGITLIRQAREIKLNLPAILLTGYAEQVTSVAMIAGSNFHVLRKPVESERLIGKIELLLTR